MAAIRTLLIEDNEADALRIRAALSQYKGSQFLLTHVERLQEGMERLGREMFDVILLDLGLPDSKGIATLQTLHPVARDKPVLVLTGVDDEALAIRALQEGAQDYLVKGDDAVAVIPRAIRYAIERKQADEAHRSAEQRLMLGIDAAEVGIWDLDAQAHRLVWSHHHERLFGLKPGEFDGRLETFTRCVHPDDRERVKQAGDLASRDGGELRHEFRVVWPDGSIHWIEGRGRVIGDGQKPTRMLGTVMDISARKAAEHAAKSAEEAARLRDAELAHVSRLGMVGQMATGLAHELTQPLAAILNYASVALDQSRAKKPAMEQIQTAIAEVMEEARRAGVIIGRLRSFVRKQQPQRALLDVNDLVKEAAEIMSFELRRREVRLELQLSPSLAPVWADRIQVEQVLVNLIYNALEALEDVPASSASLTLQTMASDGRQSMRICVIDSGTGIAPENMPKLFEPFFTTKSKGLGMGLNICRSIIESHGGRITAEANSPRGMQFSFTLPVAESKP